jgi:hypothetical protein
MSLAAWLRPPRRTLTLFVCLMAALGIALGWLAWQVLQRDRRGAWSLECAGGQRQTHRGAS